MKNILVRVYYISQSILDFINNYVFETLNRNIYKLNLAISSESIKISQIYNIHALSLFSQSFPTVCDPVDCSPPGSFLHGVLQARILEWVAVTSSRASFRSRDRIAIFWSPALAGGFFTTSTPGKPVCAEQHCRVTQSLSCGLSELTPNVQRTGLRDKRKQP